MDIYKSSLRFQLRCHVDAVLRFGNVLWCGVITFLLTITLWPFDLVAGADSVVVELVEGRRLRATSIEADPDSPSRILLTNQQERIRMQRSVAWMQVKKIDAPAAILRELAIPPSVMVVETDIPSNAPRELTLHLEATDLQTNARRVRDFAGRNSLPEIPGPSPDPEGFRFEGPTARDGRSFSSNRVPVLKSRPEALPPRMNLGAIPGEGIVNVNCLVPLGCDPGVVVGIRDAFPGAQSRAWKYPDPRELIVSARAFNRNGLADWNSLEVQVQGRTASGQTCLVRGSLQCTLWVRRAKLIRAYGELFFEEPRDLYRVAQWSQFLDGSETNSNGVQSLVLNLPQRPSDQNLNWGEVGMLVVQLDIPGQGRLATSSEAIPLRQGGPTRSRSVVDFGSSHLPQESVSEGTFDAGNWPQPSSGIRPDRRIFTFQP